MQKTASVLNGVNLHRLNETIKAIVAQPGLAKFEFRLKNEWVNGAHSQSVVKGFYGAGSEDESRTTGFALGCDEPDVLLGTDGFPNPAEYTLHALAGCLTVSLVYHAAARGYNLTRMETRFEGDIDLRGFLGLDDSVRKGFTEIRVSIDIDGDFSDEERKEILSLTQYSPVFDTISNAVPVKIVLAEKVDAVEVDC